MNHDESMENASAPLNLAWPFCLLTVGFIILLCYQLVIIFGQRSALQNQIAQQADAVTRSVQTQTALQRVVTDLVALSETDSEAKAVVTKYKISLNNKATPAK